MKDAFKASTPFPNTLLDVAMPNLRDTEWRLLCVIVRQTLGWHNARTQARKERDWLTQAQLVEKIGRDRAALSRAIDALVREQYIEVRNEQGKSLSSPSQRRQCKGRLYYMLHPRLLSNSESGNMNIEKTSVKSEHQTPLSNSLLDEKETKSEYDGAPKANTTKETHTKETDTKGINKNSLDRLTAKISRGEIAETDQTSIREILTKGQPEYSDTAKAFTTLFGQVYERMKNQKAHTSLTFADVHRLEKLLASRPLLDWKPILQAFFASDALYISRRNHSIPAFLDSCHIFLVRHPACKSP